MLHFSVAAAQPSAPAAGVQRRRAVQRATVVAPSKASSAHHPEGPIALLGGAMIPFRRKALVFGHPTTDVISNGKIILRLSHTLLGSQRVPGKSGFIAFGNAAAKRIFHAKNKLRFHIALLGGLQIASRRDVAKLDKKLNKISRKLNALDKAMTEPNGAAVAAE